MVLHTHRPIKWWVLTSEWRLANTIKAYCGVVYAAAAVQAWFTEACIFNQLTLSTCCKRSEILESLTLNVVLSLKHPHKIAHFYNLQFYKGVRGDEAHFTIKTFYIHASAYTTFTRFF